MQNNWGKLNIVCKIYTMMAPLNVDAYYELSLYRYTMAHIWACPPSEGDDYIFHCHPQEQKIPKPKRLQEWYKKMLDKGMVERIVLDYKVSINAQLINDTVSSVI